MMVDSLHISLLVALVSLAVGIVVFWAQPARFTNQVFLLSAVLISAATACIYGADVASEAWLPGEVGPLNWLRAMNALVAITPWALWLLKAAILSSDERVNASMRHSFPLLGLGIFFAGLCFSDWFYLPRYTPGEFERGAVYPAFFLFFVASNLVLVATAAKQLRTVTGIQRVEIQFLVVSLGTGLILCAALALATYFSGITEFRKQIKFVLLATYALTAWGITVYRIFDVRQVFLSLGQRAAVAFGLGLTIVGLREIFYGWVPAPADFWLGVAVAAPLAPWLDRWTQGWLQLSSEKATAEWRATVLAISHAEAGPENLASAFEALLREKCSSASATLLFPRDDGHVGGALIFPANRPGQRELCRLGWATPESLKRRRQSPALDDLAEFLRTHSLGAIVAIPHGSPSPALLLAVGIKSTRWPFTYPEIQRLQSIAELMDNILSHARLAADAALKARTEHLAMMARGLAHDLKNLITPISSFIVHADGKFPAASAEAEVHAAAKRSVRRITDYVSESLFFSNRLTPRIEHTEILPLLESVREFHTDRAAARGIVLSVASDGPAAFWADRVLLQRMLGNLVDNAIDASAPGQMVKLRWQAAAPGHVRFEIEDEGCGIAPEHLGRVFEPYFTTKHFGDEVRGFGLGLAICEKIARLHHGTIRVHSEPGRGTTVSVTLPDRPPATAPTADPTTPA